MLLNEGRDWKKEKEVPSKTLWSSKKCQSRTSKIQDGQKRVSERSIAMGDSNKIIHNNGGTKYLCFH